jgi:hypothetical protein
LSLSAFQTGLGHLVRAGEANRWDTSALSSRERKALRAIAASDGLRFTANIQRSWCAGRAALAARFTLSRLPEIERRTLIDDWVAAGGGANAFFAAETEEFCEFIAARLPSPSHTLTICRVEQATVRAGAAAAGFVAPDTSCLANPGCRLRTGRGAALVCFFAEPAHVLDVLPTGAAFPPLTEQRHWVLFAPGIEGLSHPADEATAGLWQHLAATEAATIAALREARFTDPAIEAFIRIGAAESAC